MGVRPRRRLVRILRVSGDGGKDRIRGGRVRGVIDQRRRLHHLRHGGYQERTVDENRRRKTDPGYEGGEQVGQPVDVAADSPDSRN